MSLPAELLLPCTELQKQAEELVRKNTPCCAPQDFLTGKNPVLIERRGFDGLPDVQEYSELLDQVRGCLCSNCCCMEALEKEAGTTVHAVRIHPAGQQRVVLASNAAVCELTRQRSSPRAALSGSCWSRPSLSAPTRPACARNAASTRCSAVRVL